MPENAPVPFNRTERVLVAIIVALVVMALVAIAGTMFGAAIGAEMSSGLWPSLMLIGYLALPAAFVLIVTFIIVSARRRRPTRDGGR